MSNKQITMNQEITQTAEATEQDMPITAATEEDVQRFPIRIGRTTYLVGLHFSETSKETLEDKVKRLILRDVENGDF